jgi:hypothetical protein
MYEDNETNNSNYEGLFARQPDSVEHTVWGAREVHEQPLGPNVVVNRDWYGNSQVEQSGFNW